jgi:hypothetical protein
MDPLGYASGDKNLFRYVSNEPTIATDPSGTQGRTVFLPVPNLSGHEVIPPILPIGAGKQPPADMGTMSGGVIWPIVWRISPRGQFDTSGGEVIQHVIITSNVMYQNNEWSQHPIVGRFLALDYWEAWYIPNNRRDPIPVFLPGPLLAFLSQGLDPNGLAALAANPANDFYALRPINKGKTKGTVNWFGEAWYFPSLNDDDLQAKPLGFVRGPSNPNLPKFSPAVELLWTPNSPVVRNTLMAWTHSNQVYHGMSIDWDFERGKFHRFMVLRIPE